jgi:hypothetical protein
MLNPVDAPDSSLPGFLASRARSSSDSRLALDATVGFLVALAAAMWGGPAWHFIVAAASCFFAFGLWGIADRELRDRGPAVPVGIRRSLRTTQIVACIIGVVATLTLLLSFLGIALGRIIS